MDSHLLIQEDRQAQVLNAIALLSRIYWGPDPESCRQLLEGTLLRSLEALGLLVDDKFAGPLAKLKACQTRFTDHNALFEHLEETYVRLFINDRNGVIIPLYASCHADEKFSGKNSPLMGPPAVEMKNRFKKVGLSLGDDIHEPADHISIELEYLYYLLEKGWSDNRREFTAEAASFSAKIMLPWILRLQARLTAVEPENPFYGPMTDILCALLEFIGGVDGKIAP